MHVYLIAAGYAGLAAADFESCTGQRCQLCGNHTGTYTSAALQTTTYTVCADGVRITGAYILAPHQTVTGGAGPAPLFDGDIIIQHGSTRLDNLRVNGGVSVIGSSCQKTVIENVDTTLGVRVLPAGRGVINIDGSRFAGISAAPGSAHAQYPLGIAHAVGEVSVTCAPGVSTVVQPAAVGPIKFAPKYTDCDQPPVLDLSQVFGVFGTDLERVEFNSTPEPKSLFLTTYWHTALAISALGFFLKYVGLST